MRLSHLMQLDELEDRHAKDGQFFPGLMMRVVDGDSLNEIAKEWFGNGSVLREWIKREDDREIAYQEAIERKNEMRSEELKDRTAAAAFATVQDAQSSSGEWLDVAMWPKGLLAAADSVEFGPNGTPYKIKMDAGKAADRLGKMLGLDKTGQTNVSFSMSLVGVLSEMPPAPRRVRQDVEDAELIEQKAIAPESVEADPPSASVSATRELPPERTPGRMVSSLGPI